MTPQTVIQRLRQELGLEPVRVFRTCCAADPMPTDADRLQWRHPDADAITTTFPFPPDVPRLVIACPVCGDFWTVPL